jgi:hypothetical protein
MFVTCFRLISCFPYTSILKMETTYSSKTSRNLYKTLHLVAGIEEKCLGLFGLWGFATLSVVRLTSKSRIPDEL